MSEPITRPNGKPYRRRAPLRVERYTDMGDDIEAVAVLGTHDLELAAQLAANDIQELDLDATKPVTTWWRLVPWGYDFDQSWIEDDVRGAPAVLFSVLLD